MSKMIGASHQVPACVHVMGLHVEDEVVGLQSGDCSGVVQFGGVDPKKTSKYRIHRGEAGRHSAGCAEELTAIDSQTL
jgi:hypothetical protein